jgi:tetratricopeptide (TPR) repeat protein
MEAIGNLLEKILTHYERKEYTDAEKLADELISANPNFHRGLFLKGVILEETGRKAEAKRYYDQAGNLFTLFFRLAMQLQVTDPQRAIEYYRRVSEMDNKNNMVWLNMGLLYEKGHQTDKARDCFRNLSPLREILSRIVIPTGFMLFLVVGAVMMLRRGEKTLASIVVASAVFCLFWLKRDAGKAVQMLLKKKQYKL